MWCKCKVFYRWWSMNDKSIHGFLEMWSLNAFLCEHEKLPAVLQTSVSLTMKSFDSVTSVWTNAKQKQQQQNILLQSFNCASKKLFNILNQKEKTLSTSKPGNSMILNIATSVNMSCSSDTIQCHKAVLCMLQSLVLCQKAVCQVQ